MSYEHNHLADLFKTKVEEMYEAKLVEGTRQLNKLPNNLWKELIGEVQREVGAVGIMYLTKAENFTRTLLNRRRKQLPAVPRTFEDIKAIPRTLFPEEFLKTNTGEDWLILNTAWDEEDNDEMILGFSSPSQLELMKTSKVLYMDGTFDIVKLIEFALQLYVILGRPCNGNFPLKHICNCIAFVPLADTANGVSVPVAFFICSNKSKKTYLRILSSLKDDCGVPAPETVLCDFEAVKIMFILILISLLVVFQQATIAALKDVYPETRVALCDVHFKR